MDKFRVEGGRLKVVEVASGPRQAEFYRGIVFGLLFSVPLWICIGLIVLLFQSAKMAEPLHISKNRIRFRSLFNWRIFSLVFGDNSYDLVELDSNDPQALVRRRLYQGPDAETVKKVIVKEVCDV